MIATAWVLDVNHRARRLECEVPDGTRPLAAAAAAVRAEGIVLEGGPVGVRDREIMFLTPDSGAGRWPALADWAAADERGWRLYVEVMLGGWEPPTRALDVFHFGMGARMAAHLAHMVVMGPKRGTAGWVAAAARDGSPIPHPGMISIVTDAFGHPRCAIRTEKIDRRRFCDIDAELAWIEGEGDRSLEDWREGHLRYFHGEAASLGLTFSEDEEVFFEHFSVIATLGRSE